RMRSVGTLIFERPRPLSRQRRANHLYTLICEEPLLAYISGLMGLGFFLALTVRDTTSEDTE
ncbi:hypothetical protein, partial [Mycobacteroides abscessus]|uniref:hypothetical protein n=1 Tax=Mycobacteroides abscessus TaxID=36809 RepID=UPI001A9819FD